MHNNRHHDTEIRVVNTKEPKQWPKNRSELDNHLINFSSPRRELERLLRKSCINSKKIMAVE